MTLTINELPLRGGWLGICPMPGRDGRYAADLAAIRHWGPALVLTLTTAEEMAANGAAGFGDDLSDLGIGWAHLPVRDYGVPDDDAESRWLVVAERASELLDGGGKVLAHCMGGCGRSGAALLRLMIEAGEEPQAALVRLRAVRPCAVEKPLQFDWAMRGAAGWRAAP